MNVMKTNKKIFALLFLFAVCTFLKAQTFGPDLSKKDDLKNLGIGLISKKDGGHIKKIWLSVINENSIVYIKENNLHDYELDKIDWMEFPESKWGPLKIKFVDGQPKLFKLEPY